MGKVKEEASFTPGPWKAVPPAHGNPTEYLCVQIGEDENYSTLELKPADAKLIAASPEMYDALLPILDEAKERADYMHDTWNPDYHVELTLTIAELRAIHNALSKSRGEA